MEQAEVKTVQSPANDFTLMCENIEKNMSQINEQRTTFALEQINQDLKVCLPLMELAEQNMEPVLVEKRLQLEAANIATRALFWEDYLQTYPKSSYQRDAEYLLKQYTYFLFRGSEQSPISEDYRDRYSVETSHLETIIGLARGQKSKLSTQAQLFLEFLDMNPEQRQRALAADYRNRSSTEQILYYAQVTPPSQNYGKDCFKDAICL